MDSFIETQSGGRSSGGGGGSGSGGAGGDDDGMCLALRHHNAKLVRRFPLSLLPLPKNNHSFTGSRSTQGRTVVEAMVAMVALEVQELAAAEVTLAA